MTESCEFDVVDVENFDEGNFSPNESLTAQTSNQAALFQAALAQAQMKQAQMGQIQQIAQTAGNNNNNPSAQITAALDAATPIRAGSKRSPAEREEMVMRKKLRNRESAQRARDRQKAKMRWLEEELQKIKVRNEQLMRENLILRHMVQGNNNNNQNTNPQQNTTTTQIQQLNQQVTLQNQLQNLPKTATNQQVFQQQQQPNKSKDSEGSMPSVISTGSQNVISPQINQNGDDLLKAAAVPRNNQQQQYAAALAAIAQQNPIQANLALLQNPNQLAAAMAQATVAAAQHSMVPQQQQQQVVAQNVVVQTSSSNNNKTRPSSVGPASGCHTSDAISE